MMYLNFQKFNQNVCNLKDEMTDNWNWNKSWISWTIWRREQYESEEHVSNLKFFIPRASFEIIKFCAVVDFMHDGNQRLTDQFPFLDTMYPNDQSETRQTPFLPGKPEKRWTELELLKRTGWNETYSRYIILKGSSSCNFEIFFLQILNQSRLNWISFCCEKKFVLTIC